MNAQAQTCLPRGVDGREKKKKKTLNGNVSVRKGKQGLLENKKVGEMFSAIEVGLRLHSSLRICS